jgi:Fic family protein
MNKYIYQYPDWPNFYWDNKLLLHFLADVRNKQGKIMGRMQHLGFDLRKEAELDTLTLDILKSTEIEGEILNPEQVRSSIAKRLGLEIGGSVEPDRNVEGMVDMMMDATQHYEKLLPAERLYDWHAALFPTGRSGMYKITVAGWRDDLTGPMQVVSGAMGKEKIHYQAPDSSLIEREMDAFLNWFNNENCIDPVLKAAIAHLWFVTIHPFDDGNGRIARVLTDMLLARSDQSPQRFYSMSAQIRKERKQYYEILENTQKGDLDITAWLNWFLNCLSNALLNTESVLAKVFFKAEFWNRHSKTHINERQRLLLNKLIDGFDGKLTSSKWAKIAKCSADTALRDIKDLINKSVLQQDEAGGRSTSYNLRYMV